MQCATCQGEIDGEHHAIGHLADGRVSYIPFVEDLRTAAYELEHVLCYASSNDVETLMDLVHRHDYKIRQERETLAFLRDVERGAGSPSGREVAPPAPIDPPPPDPATIIDVTHQDVTS